MEALISLWVDFCEINYLIRVTLAAHVKCHQKLMFIVILIGKGA
jgi:hypothetical protein